MSDSEPEQEQNEPKEELISLPPRFFNEAMSDDIGELAGAMAAAQGAMSNGAKGKQGYGYKYMELGALIDIARPELAANNIAIMQSHELITSDVTGAPSVVTHTTVMHSSNQWFKSSIELPIKEMSNLSEAQMIGVNCTYGRRYALQSICLIASEEDTDATARK